MAIGTGSNPTPAAAFTPQVYHPDHVFDCGPTTPPSGSYLNASSMRRAHYDCGSDTLTELESVQATCLGQELPGRFAPAFGFCIPFNDDSAHKFQAHLFVTATVELSIDWWSERNDDDVRRAPECLGVPTEAAGCPGTLGGPVCIRLSVTYCNIVYAPFAPSCPNLPGPGTWTGRMLAGTFTEGISRSSVMSTC